MKDRETLFEIGMVVLGLGLAAGLGVLVFGRALGSRQQKRRHAEAPPAAGTFGAEYHQHISAVAAR